MWRLAAPGDPARPGPRIQLDERDEWHLMDDRRAQETTRTSSETMQSGEAGAPAAANESAQALRDAAADQVVAFLAKNPGKSAAFIAQKFSMSSQWLDDISAVVSSAVREWHDMQQQTTQIRMSVIVEPLTEQEQQFIEKWRTGLSTADLARLMGMPVDVIDAFVRRRDDGRSARRVNPQDEYLKRWNLAQAEWLQVRDADLRSQRSMPRVSLTNEAMAFIQRLKPRLSDRSLVTIMTMPEATRAAYLWQAGLATAIPPAVVSPPPAPGRPPSPQPGPSGHRASRAAD
jgi:hypothetical protein